MSVNRLLQGNLASVVTLRSEVRKPTATIHIANKFTFIERKLLNSLIHHAQNKNNKLDGEKKSLNLSQVLEDIGCNTRNRTVLKKSLRNLVSTIIEWNILKQDKTRSWGVCTFLSSGELNKGAIHYRLNAELVDQVNYPSLFAKMRLEIQSKLTSKYPLIIYEYLIDHLCRNKKEHIIIKDVPLEDVYMICGVSETYLNTDNFRYFNRKILTPAVKEINDKTDICVKIDLEKKARKVHAISFSIEKNNKITSDSDNTNTHPLIKYGVDEKVTNSLLSRYNKRRIKENLDYALNRQSINKIENIASYIVAAIKNNYAASHESNNDLLEQTEKTDSSETHRASNFDKEKFYYQEQPEDWQKKELSKFQNELKLEGNTIILSTYKKYSLKSGIVSSKFYHRFKAISKHDHETIA